MKKLIPWLVRVLTGASCAGALSLTFMFVHRGVLNLGGMGTSKIVHEDSYCPILFALFFFGFALFPLPKRFEYVLAVARSIFLTAAVILCFHIIGSGVQRSGFHLNNFLIVFSVPVFGSLLLTSRCFQDLATRQHRA